VQLNFFNQCINYHNLIHDNLSLFFMFLIFIIAVPIMIYSIGYNKEYKGRYSMKYLYTMMILFILSMLGVTASGNGIMFLVFWEIMSMSSFFLVIYEHRNSENIKSGIMYFIMTHISGLSLMLMFAFLYKYTGSFDFKVIMKASVNFDMTQKWIIFILALLGFGAKMGIMPVHAWLPKAHPSAPSNVSALMSGVMLKVAVYGFVRVTFYFLKAIPVSFGIIVIVLGTITAIISIFNALPQRNIKKMLAYSSAENIGIIMASIGLSMVASSFKIYSLALLLMIAAIFHILNHAAFKGLLFASAGSVLYATGTKNMNELGGLYKKMKFAAICAFIGTAAISVVPPFNGFASEILVFQGFIKAAKTIKGPGIVILIVTAGVLLALTSGGTVFAFVKSYGITYLGAPRTAKAQKTHKVPFSMNLGLGILAAYCILLGLLSPVIIKALAKISRGILNLSEKESSKYVNSFASSNIVPFNNEIIIISTVVIGASIVIFLGLRLLTNKKTTANYDTWACGYDNVKPSMQYTGTGLTQPIAKITAGFIGFRKEASKKNVITIKQKTSDIVEKYIYEPLVKLIDYVSAFVLRMHYGKIQIYIAYIFLSLTISIILVVNFLIV
jgi:hydrogenase-4 component B